MVFTTVQIVTTASKICPALWSSRNHTPDFFLLNIMFSVVTSLIDNSFDPSFPRQCLSVTSLFFHLPLYLSPSKVPDFLKISMFFFLKIPQRLFSTCNLRILSSKCTFKAKIFWDLLHFFHCTSSKYEQKNSSRCWIHFMAPYLFEDTFFLDLMNLF